MVFQQTSLMFYSRASWTVQLNASSCEVLVLSSATDKHCEILSVDISSNAVKNDNQEGEPG